MKCLAYSKLWVTSNMLKYPGICLEIRVFLHTYVTYLGSNFTQVLTPQSPDKAVSPISVKSPWIKGKR